MEIEEKERVRGDKKEGGGGIQEVNQLKPRLDDYWSFNVIIMTFSIFQRGD